MNEAIQYVCVSIGAISLLAYVIIQDLTIPTITALLILSLFWLTSFVWCERKKIGVEKSNWEKK